MPPVSSRITNISTPCNTSSFSVLALISSACNFTGRRLAKRLSALRIPNRPRSGRSLAFGLSHLGPPTAPSKTASAFLQAATVSSGRLVPRSSMARPPISCSSNSNVWPNFCATTVKILRASVVTSGPMPSPASTTIFAFKSRAFLSVKRFQQIGAHQSHQSGSIQRLINFFDKFAKSWSSL